MFQNWAEKMTNSHIFSEVLWQITNYFMSALTELEMETNDGLMIRKEETDSQEQEILEPLLNLQTSLQLMASHAIQFR